MGLLLGAVALPSHALTPTLTSGNAHVLVSKSDGTVVGWGSDLYGKLGTGRPIVRLSPARIEGLPEIKSVSTNAHHVLALDSAGRVWSWGRNDSAQLGQRVQRNGALPGRVLGLSNVVQVAAASQLSLALKADGSVWVWGNIPPYAQLTPEPREVAGLTNIVEIAAGNYHYFARRNDGTVWAVGQNMYNELGIGAPTGGFGFEVAPKRVLLPAGVTSVAATWLGGMARTGDGKVWTWGASVFDAPGIATPQEVSGFPAPVQRLVGENLSYLAVLTDGTSWEWSSASLTPSKLPWFSQVVDVGGDGYNFLAVNNSGRMLSRGGNAYGEAGLGNLTATDPNVAVLVPSPTNFKAVRFFLHCVLGLTSNGQIWAWGADYNGSLGDGSLQSVSHPRAVAGVANVTQLATAWESSLALDANGSVWAWGESGGGFFGRGTFSPSSVPLQVPIDAVKAIAAGFGHALYLRTDGTVWLTGYFLNTSFHGPTKVQGLPTIVAIAAGAGASFAIDELGRLWAWGDNVRGELGIGDQSPRASPVQVTLPGPVKSVAAGFRSVLAVNAAGDVYGWGDITNGLLGTNPGGFQFVTTPTKVPGLSGVMKVAASNSHALALLANGTVMSWGAGWPPDHLGRDVFGVTPWYMPGLVEGLDSVADIAAGWSASFAMRADGTVWGWGANWTSGLGPSVGDGTIVRRNRPVVVLRENGAGRLDTNDWFLDAKPGTPKSIPPGKVPKVIPLASSLSSSGVLNVDARINVKVADQAKTLGLYVTGLVPVEFFAQPGMAPGAQAKVAGMKAGTTVLVNLTPAGWTVASGQLTAYTSGTNNAFLDASRLLVNVNPASIPGARFCIGYGESATDMLRTETIRDFLSLEGASTSALDQSCLLSGVYVDGPRSSAQGSAVPVRAVVVGQSPTGTVRFKERFADISSDVAITPVNAAVSDASISYTPPGPGEFAFGAGYGGDGSNIPASSEVPLRHVVQAVQAATTTRLDAPVTSEVGLEISLMAEVCCNRPSGTVQFKRGGVDHGAPVAVVDDRAVTSAVGLGIGSHSFTAHYSGDGGHQSSASTAFTHQVLNVSTSAVTLGSSANPAPLGDTVTLTATAIGTNPTGTVTLRERAQALQTQNLSGGTATFTLSGLSAGIHVFAIDYSGDANNPAATSNAVFQQVTLNLPLQGDLDGDGLPNGVEAVEGLRPDLKDNDIFANARLFAMQQYRDFLGREGDASGVTFWTGQLSGGAQTRAQMVESYFNSAEFQGSGAPVARLYFAYFLRIPDYTGLIFWIGQFRSGTALQSISNAFAAGPEFANRYGALTSGQFVNLVYQNVLGRPPDAAGFAHWTGQLGGGMTRGQMMVAFSESPEYRALIDSEIYVTMMYLGMLRREPDLPGFDFWVGYKDSGKSGLDLINGFLAAPEYRSRFLP